MRLVLDDKTIPTAARDLDLTESALRQWVERAGNDRTHGRTGLTTAEREELARLRNDNRELRTEREILKKAASSSRSAKRNVRLDRAEKAVFPIRLMCRAIGITRAGTTRGADAQNRRMRSVTGA